MSKKRVVLGFLIASIIATFLIVFIPIFLIWTGTIDYTKGSNEVLGITLWKWHDIYLYSKNIAIGILVVLITLFHSLKGYKILATVNLGILLSALTNDLPMMILWRFILSCILTCFYTVITIHKFKNCAITKSFLVTVLILSIISWMVSLVQII